MTAEIDIELIDYLSRKSSAKYYCQVTISLASLTA